MPRVLVFLCPSQTVTRGEGSWCTFTVALSLRVLDCRVARVRPELRRADATVYSQNARPHVRRRLRLQRQGLTQRRLVRLDHPTPAVRLLVARHVRNLEDGRHTHTQHTHTHTRCGNGKESRSPLRQPSCPPTACGTRSTSRLSSPRPCSGPRTPARKHALHALPAEPSVASSSLESVLRRVLGSLIRSP